MIKSGDPDEFRRIPYFWNDGAAEKRKKGGQNAPPFLI
jgi:hypothetical protein